MPDRMPVTKMAIARLAAQVASGLDRVASDDEITRAAAGMALSQDLTDEELSMLVQHVEQYLGRPYRRSA